jgi:hypothetical protein
MRAVKQQLDPRRLFNPGRFVDGIYSGGAWTASAPARRGGQSAGILFHDGFWKFS